MDEIQKKYMDLLAAEFDMQCCDYCNYSELCTRYQNEVKDNTVLCDVIFKVNDIAQANNNE